jgi:hypothetical protein
MSDDASSQSHSRSRSEPLSKTLIAPSRPQNQNLVTPPPTLPSRRSRAPSDPFVDSNSLSHSPSKSNHSSLRGAPRNPHNEEDDSYFPTSASGIERGFDEQGDNHYLRTWTSPDLSNPEFTSLLSLFPPFLSSRTLPRFPVTISKGARHDLEEGDYDDSEEVRCEVRVGSGVMWIGTKERGESWRGNLWERFMAWWRRILC